MKTYVKPEIKFENFALSESIATSCAEEGKWIVRGAADTNECYAILPGLGGNIKLYANDNCNETDYEYYCSTYIQESMQLVHSY